MNFFNELLVNSHSGDYSNINDVILKYFKRFKECEIILQEVAKNKHNIIIFWGNPKLLINVHIDTISPTPNWLTNPYELYSKNDKLFGLGTCDTKGNIYAIYEAIQRIKPQNLMLLFSVDEETNSIESGVTFFLKSSLCAEIKRVIVCEPTDNIPSISHKGYCSFFLKTSILSRHSSNTEFLNDNAILKMSKVMGKLVDKGFNIGKIEGGKSGNVIAPDCTMLISIRSYENSEVILNNVLEIVDNEIKVEIKTYLPPLNQDNVLINNQKYGTIDFWTEASLFSNSKINSIVYGIGNIKQAHTENEYITKESLEKGIDFFYNLIKSENKNDRGVFEIFKKD